MKFCSIPPEELRCRCGYMFKDHTRTGTDVPYCPTGGTTVFMTSKFFNEAEEVWRSRTPCQSTD